MSAIGFLALSPEISGGAKRLGFYILIYLVNYIVHAFENLRISGSN